jgi:hypothetical protein
MIDTSAAIVGPQVLMKQHSVLRGLSAAGFGLAELETLGAAAQAEGFLPGSAGKVETPLANFCLSERIGNLETRD